MPESFTCPSPDNFNRFNCDSLESRRAEQKYPKVKLYYTCTDYSYNVWSNEYLVLWKTLTRQTLGAIPKQKKYKIKS